MFQPVPAAGRIGQPRPPCPERQRSSSGLIEQRNSRHLRPTGCSPPPPTSPRSRSWSPAIERQLIDDLDRSVRFAYPPMLLPVARSQRAARVDHVGRAAAPACRGRAGEHGVDVASQLQTRGRRLRSGVDSTSIPAAARRGDQLRRSGPARVRSEVTDPDGPSVLTGRGAITASPRSRSGWRYRSPSTARRRWYTSESVASRRESTRPDREAEPRLRCTELVEQCCAAERKARTPGGRRVRRTTPDVANTNCSMTATEITVDDRTGADHLCASPIDPAADVDDLDRVRSRPRSVISVPRGQTTIRSVPGALPHHRSFATRTSPPPRCTTRCGTGPRTGTATDRIRPASATIRCSRTRRSADLVGSSPLIAPTRSPTPGSPRRRYGRHQFRRTEQRPPIRERRDRA